MFLDLDGHLIVGGMPYLPLLSGPLEHHAVSNPCIQEASPTLWEEKVSRLYQRVCEVKVLVREDLHELLPALDALRTTSTTLLEHTTQVAEAIASYERICRECEQALEGLFVPFQDTGVLERAGRTA